MSAPGVRFMLDPVPFARDEGRKAGQREMRDRVRDAFAAFAATHPNAVISDELWAFVAHIERMEVQ